MKNSSDCVIQATSAVAFSGSPSVANVTTSLPRKALHFPCVYGTSTVLCRFSKVDELQ